MRPLIIAIPAIIILFLFFSLVSALSGVWALLTILYRRDLEQFSKIVHAQDCLAAAMAGFTGRNTVSKECGRCQTCWLCPYICKVMHLVVERQHCEKEAE